MGLPYGCKDGACGSCKCQKLSGTVVHGPHQAKALSAQEEADGFILTCCAVPHSDVALLARSVTDESAYPVRKFPVRLARHEQLAPDVMRLFLQLPASEVFRFHAGQYVEVVLRDGSRRAYSMANEPSSLLSTPQLELHIRHMPGGKFTDHVFGDLKDKEILRVEGPFGSFYLREDSQAPIVLLASGTGFAPVKALIEHLYVRGSTRLVALYWGGRRPADLYLHDWVLDKKRHMPNLHYVPVISDALPEDQWQGRTGFVHQAVLEDLPDLSGFQVYACGAPIVVDSARSQYTAQAGLPPEQFFADAFTSEADKH